MLKTRLILPLLLGAGLAWSGGAASAKTAAEAPAAARDELSAMFTWWNHAMATPGGLTRKGFGKFFTEDATLTINGVQAIANLDGWVTHFQRIQASGAKVEIVVPFKEVFAAPGRIYTYHVIRSMRNGVSSCMLAAGHATLRGGLISSITLVRVSLDPAKGDWDPNCWPASPSTPAVK